MFVNICIIRLPVDVDFTCKTSPRNGLMHFNFSRQCLQVHLQIRITTGPRPLLLVYSRYGNTSALSYKFPCKYFNCVLFFAVRFAFRPSSLDLPFRWTTVCFKIIYRRRQCFESYCRGHPGNYSLFLITRTNNRSFFPFLCFGLWKTFRTKTFLFSLFMLISLLQQLKS